MTELLNAALKYADNDWLVFPTYGIVNGRCECGTNCGSPGKHPRTSHGVLDASTNLDQIKAWWTRWPNSNIGVRTGKESGIYVVDLDNKRSVDLGNGELIGEGEHSLRTQSLAIGTSLPETLTQITGSGGRHLLFTYPTQNETDGATYGNRAAVLPSVDIRGDGGYIIVPPSLHQSGNRYQWIDTLQPTTLLTPSWLKLLTTPASNTLPLSLEIAPDLRIREGEGRHEWLFKMGSKLRGQHGLPYVALFGSLSAYNAQVLVPPLKSAEVEHIVQSCMKFDPGFPALEVDTNIGSPLEIEEGIDVAISFSDFMADEPNPFVPLVSKLLHDGEVMIIGGQPNIGKTWVVMDMMMGIANGTEFARHFHCSKGSVLFIDEEGSRRGDWERFQMLLAGRDASAFEFPLYTKIASGIKIDSDKGRAAISRLIERYRPAAVFMDSLVRMHGGDESNNRAMASFFEQITKLKENYDTSFIFTHHIRKPPKEGDQDPTWVLRGAGDIQGFPDSVLILQPGEDTSIVQGFHTKMRNGDKLRPFELSLRIDDTESIATVAYLNEIERRIDTTSRTKVIATLGRSGPLTAEQIAGILGLSIKTVKDHLTASAAAGRVHVTDSDGVGWWAVGGGPHPH